MNDQMQFAVPHSPVMPWGNMTRIEVRALPRYFGRRSTSLRWFRVTATSDLFPTLYIDEPATLSISTAPCGLAARCSSTEVAACASHGNASGRQHTDQGGACSGET